MGFTRKQVFTLALSLLFGFVAVLPHVSHAVGTAADAMCTPGNYSCPFGSPPPPGQPGPCMLNKPCFDTTNEFTTGGVCIAPVKCLAKTTSGKDGFGLDQVAKILGDLMGKLMQQGGGQQPPSTPPTSGTPTGPNGCATTYEVTQPSTDPCAIYVPNLSDSLLDTTTDSNSLFDLLNSDSNTNTNTTQNVSDQLDETVTPNTNTSTAPDPTTNTTVAATTTATIFTTPASFLLPGLRGDIEVLNNAGTVFAGSRDQSRNTEVAGFYGGSTFSGQGTGIIASLCRSRPWASSILSYVLPANFFDGLCIARGYQVGNPPPAQTQPTVTVTQTQPQTTTHEVETPATSTGPVVPPRVRVWAVPATVTLGSRTSIFWTSQGVTSCIVTSPDGSFSQNTLSGGASTVALTGDTTFTISCLAPDGTPVTDFVTVRLAI